MSENRNPVTVTDSADYSMPGRAPSNSPKQPGTVCLIPRNQRRCWFFSLWVGKFPRMYKIVADCPLGSLAHTASRIAVPPAGAANFRPNAGL